MENSEVLLKKAVAALQEADIDESMWAVGGGTVLAKYYNHRISKDIDIFIYDRQLLSRLSPRNEVAIRQSFIEKRRLD